MNTKGTEANHSRAFNIFIALQSLHKICHQCCTMLCSSLIVHAEEVRHFLEGCVLIACGTNRLETRTDCRTDGTVNFGQLLGLTDTLFARLMIRHLFISG